jgi:hypothetical protein
VLRVVTVKVVRLPLMASIEPLMAVATSGHQHVTSMLAVAWLLLAKNADDIEPVLTLMPTPPRRPNGPAP